MVKGGWTTRVYAFQDRDPEIDNFQKIWQKDRLKENDLAVLAGLSASTVSNMFTKGTTRRPQHATFAKMASAMGYKYGLERDDKPDYEAELPKAREEYKAHKQALAKKRGRTNGKARAK
jgi:transcriptional regulator with XRE-family HTH domain